MIIVKVQGGLGNQMFQYAFGRALAEKHSQDLYLDCSEYLRPSCKREYGLDHFNIRAKKASCGDVKSMVTPHFALRKKLKKIFAVPYSLSSTHILERNFNFQPSILEFNCGYFDGFWQTQKYFSGISDIVRKDLTFKDAVKYSGGETFAKITSLNSVSLHIRRGDYVKVKRTRKRFSVIRAGYFKRAVEYMRSKLDTPHFFIFTDDPKWVSENFPAGEDYTLVSSSGMYEDLFLMAQCRHNIIFNSSFSWWGAWLNGNPGKIVVAPDMWFTPHYKLDYSDVVPEEWIKLNTGYFESKEF